MDFFRIVKNDLYELQVNKGENYLIIAYFGIWDNTSQLQNYIEDIKHALLKVSKGFNLIIDLRQYRGSKSEYISLHVDGQNMAIEAGLNKTAVIIQNNPMLKVTIDYIFQQSGINATYFNNYRNAEQWISKYSTELQ